MSLMEDLTKLRGMHQELLGLAQGCLKILREGRLDDLDAVWAKRGRLFERIEALGRRLAPAFAAWPQTLAGLTAKQRDRAAGAVQDIRAAGAQVLEIDAEVAVLLNEAKDSLGGEIKRIDNGKKLMRAYSTRAPKKGPMRISRTG